MILGMRFLLRDANRDEQQSCIEKITFKTKQASCSLYTFINCKYHKLGKELSMYVSRKCRSLFIHLLSNPLSTNTSKIIKAIL